MKNFLKWVLAGGIGAGLGYTALNPLWLPADIRGKTRDVTLEEKVETQPALFSEEVQSVPSSLPTHWLKGFDDYNDMAGIIEDIEEEIGIPDDLLHLTVLVESKGGGGDRFEPGFKRRYIDNGRYGFDKNTLYQRVFKGLKDPKLTEEEFKKQLATSVGPAQILYCTAIDLGFRGSLDELRGTETNLKFGAKMIKKQSGSTDFDWKKVLTAYNTGSVNGTPTRGHLERGADYRKLLGKE
ncbi:MAG: lytic transglycosylase domain-containing protein [Candidatus Woesearchaeota archaeon]